MANNPRLFKNKYENLRYEKIKHNRYNEYKYVLCSKQRNTISFNAQAVELLWTSTDRKNLGLGWPIEQAFMKEAHYDDFYKSFYEHKNLPALFYDEQRFIAVLQTDNGNPNAADVEKNPCTSHRSVKRLFAQHVWTRRLPQPSELPFAKPAFGFLTMDKQPTKYQNLRFQKRTANNFTILHYPICSGQRNTIMVNESYMELIWIGRHTQRNLGLGWNFSSTIMPSNHRTDFYDAIFKGPEDGSALFFDGYRLFGVIPDDPQPNTACIAEILRRAVAYLAGRSMQTRKKEVLFWHTHCRNKSLHPEHNPEWSSLLDSELQPYVKARVYTFTRANKHTEKYGDIHNEQNTYYAHPLFRIKPDASLWKWREPYGNPTCNSPIFYEGYDNSAETTSAFEKAIATPAILDQNCNFPSQQSDDPEPKISKAKGSKARKKKHISSSQAETASSSQVSLPTPPQQVLLADAKLNETAGRGKKRNQSTPKKVVVKRNTRSHVSPVAKRSRLSSPVKTGAKEKGPGNLKPNKQCQYEMWGNKRGRHKMVKLPLKAKVNNRKENSETSDSDSTASPPTVINETKSPKKSVKLKNFLSQSHTSSQSEQPENAGRNSSDDEVSQVRERYSRYSHMRKVCPMKPEKDTLFSLGSHKITGL